jgi:hypothetical protein
MGCQRSRLIADLHSRSTAASEAEEIAMRRLWLSLVALAMSVSAAQAVVVQIDFSVSTSGVPNPAVGTVVIDNPFNVDSLNSLIGLTPSNFNFDVDGFDVFTYDASSDQFWLGGSENSGAGGIAVGSNDFLIWIDDFLTAPVVLQALLVQDDQQGFIAAHAVVQDKAFKLPGLNPACTQ